MTDRRIPRPAAFPDNALDVWIAIQEAVPEVARQPEVLDAYTPTIRQVYAMNRLDAEVNNGGFSQFLFNGGGAWFDDAIAGFDAAGLEAERQLTVEAADAGVAKIELLRAAWEGNTLESYAAWDEAAGFDAFDDRWYDLADVYPVLDRLVAEHADEIWEPA